MKHFNFTPTPVAQLEYYSNKFGCNMWVKRDDLFATAGGGSKARMLQYILASNQDYDVIVTAGGPYSNFNRACALMCARLNKKMHLIEYAEDEEHFITSLNYRVCTLADIRKTRCAKSNVPETIKRVIDSYTSMGLRTNYIYGGGKGLEGVFSYYDAIKEVYAQNIKIDFVFVACGTGTTLTGICAGLQKYYPSAKVHAISVARTWDNEKDVLEDNMKLLNNYLCSNYNFENLVFYEDFLCGGYAKKTIELEKCIKECISHEGMLIDPIYSGKAFYGMIQTIQNDMEKYSNKNILFWNTGAIYNLLA